MKKEEKEYLCKIGNRERTAREEAVCKLICAKKYEEEKSAWRTTENPN